MADPRIMIVEPDILVRGPLSDYLRDCGYEVVAAVDAAEARTVLSDPSSNVDIVLADVDGAGAGFSLARWIRANCPGIRVVLAGSVAAAASKAGDLCEDGPALAKPYDHRLVLDEIRRLRAARQRNSGDSSPD